MQEQLKKRLEELKAEFDRGQKRLEELDAESNRLCQALLRISGAVQVIEEELAKADPAAAGAGSGAGG
jgi:predicted nuclease with TOPRIM domain